MKTIRIAGQDCDAIDIKNWVVTRGVRIDDDVYEFASGKYNLSRDVRRLTCVVLSNGFTCTLYDMGPRLAQSKDMYYWSDKEAEEFAPQLATPLRIRMDGDRIALTYKGDELIDYVTFPRANSFYDRATSSGMPFRGNVSLLGNDSYVVFGYEWPCEFAAAGLPCQYCHSGNETAAQARNGEAVKEPIPLSDMEEMVNAALDGDLAVSVLYTGGSTFDGVAEHVHLCRVIEGIHEGVGRASIPGQILFYLTPPKDLGQLDHYVANGIDRLGMSVEVWDEKIAARITPGKIRYTSRERHLRALEYAAGKFGPNVAFCQLIVGCEPIESLAEGVRWCAERGVIPVYSILQQHSLKIDGRTNPPDLDIFKRAKEVWLDAYARYDIEPAGWEYSVGCIESEFYEAVHGTPHRRYPRPASVS